MFREVTRKKQCLTKDKIIEILRTEKRGGLSVMGDEGDPYGVPINYWYNEENGTKGEFLWKIIRLLWN